MSEKKREKRYQGAAPLRRPDETLVLAAQITRSGTQRGIAHALGGGRTTFLKEWRHPPTCNTRLRAKESLEPSSPTLSQRTTSTCLAPLPYSAALSFPNRSSRGKTT